MLQPVCNLFIMKTTVELMNLWCDCNKTSRKKKLNSPDSCHPVSCQVMEMWPWWGRSLPPPQFPWPHPAWLTGYGPAKRPRYDVQLVSSLSVLFCNSSTIPLSVSTPAHPPDSFWPRCQETIDLSLCLSEVWKWECVRASLAWLSRR